MIYLIKLYRIDEERIRPDNLGNMHYGGVGLELFGETYLLLGGGGAQLLLNTKNAGIGNDHYIDSFIDGFLEGQRFMESLLSGGYGDHEGDADAIKRGFELKNR